ncbi:HIT family protein [Granulosicoccaceae sp. 1_MG-2023]|nr:HIT family protein [Granulosicoccaceae sp. 1_MG-2023]
MAALYQNTLIRIEAEPSTIPWLKVFTLDGCREFSDCSDETRAEVWRVLHILEKGMLAFYRPDKINLASFANYMPVVHWHVMARYKNDTHFPEPMWGIQQRNNTIEFAPLEEFIASVKGRLDGH